MSTEIGQLVPTMLHVKQRGPSTTVKVKRALQLQLLLPPHPKPHLRPNHSGSRSDFNDSNFDRPDDRMSAVPGVTFFVDRC